MCPLFQGLGYAAIAVNVFIGFYYNVIIAYCIYYLVFSFNTELPWKDCHGEPDCFKRSNFSLTCEQEKAIFAARNVTQTRSPSEVYFYDTVLEMTGGIENLGGLNPQLTVCLIVAWVCVFLALIKGVASLGKLEFDAKLYFVELLVIGFVDYEKEKCHISQPHFHT